MEATTRKGWLSALVLICGLLLLIGGWLGANWLIVHERLVMRREIKAGGGRDRTINIVALGIALDYHSNVMDRRPMPRTKPPARRSEVTWLREKLGDKNVLEIDLAPEQSNDAMVRLVRELFPEANVHRSGEWEASLPPASELKAEVPGEFFEVGSGDE